MKTPDPNFLCCELSEQQAEPQFGTAVTAEVWFMLEYTGPWRAKATTDNDLPAGIQVWLDAQGQKHNGRLQFIRQFQPASNNITFFIGVNQESAPRLYQFELSDYEALLPLDVAAVVAGDPQFDSQLVTDTHYFICTNGKRDRSCALYGAALYRTFAQAASSQVWMTTHLGGHRFAATLLTLPDGICYGRIHPHESRQLIQANRQKEVWLEKVRGRTTYSQVVQTADYYLRRETGQTQVTAFTFKEAQVLADGRHQISFTAQDKTTFTLFLAPAPPLTVYASSGQFNQKEVPQYQLLEIIKTD